MGAGADLPPPAGGRMGGMPSPRRRAQAPVEIRSMSSPKPGWDLEQAVRLLADGYTPTQVERMTGFAAAHVTAQVRARDRRPSGAS